MKLLNTSSLKNNMKMARRTYMHSSPCLRKNISETAPSLTSIHSTPTFKQQETKKKASNMSPKTTTTSPTSVGRKFLQDLYKERSLVPPTSTPSTSSEKTTRDCSSPPITTSPAPSKHIINKTPQLTTHHFQTFLCRYNCNCGLITTFEILQQIDGRSPSSFKVLATSEKPSGHEA